MAGQSLVEHGVGGWQLAADANPVKAIKTPTAVNPIPATVSAVLIHCPLPWKVLLAGHQLVSHYAS
ncbi:MAG: hypothetical protein L3J97_01800 [Thermoplasmata archaeon]|nr:hypothetical protein [Thermoplasmata archaeon]